MSQIARSPVQVDGRKGIIIHDKLCSDGPVDPETGELMIDPETGEPYEGPNDDMAALMHDYLLKLRSNVNIDGGRQTAPRFGVLSLIAMHTPIYVYDHPAFKKITNTAFTDGLHVFIDADFMRKLVIQEEESDGRKSGVLFVLLHELLHKLLSHVDRLQRFPRAIANIAEDLVINGKLVKGFTMISPVDLMLEIGIGMKPSEADKYHSMSEEVVAEMLLINERKKREKMKQEQSQSGGGGGSDDGGGDGGDDPESGDNDNDNSPSDGNNGNKKDKDNKGNNKDPNDLKEGDLTEQEYSKGGYSVMHHIKPEDLLEILEREGLQNIKDALNLPDSDDVEGIGKMKEQGQYKDMDAVQIAMSQASRANGQYPGQHIAEYASSVIGDLGKGKMTWKLALKKLIQGDGQKMGHSDDEAAITWLLDKDTLGVDPFYSGTLIPQENDETIISIVDTSGSTSGGNQRKEYLQELLGLKSGLSGSDQARKVIVYSGDSILRGEPLEITAHNINKIKHDGVPIFGDGGTNFLSCLNQVLALPVMKKEKIKAVLYFTDCCDSPPRRVDFEDKIADGIKFAFFTTPGLWNEKWNEAVSSWAEVYCIEEGTQVNLDNAEINKNTRKNNRLG